MSDGLNKKALVETLAEEFDLSKKASGEIVDFVFEKIIEVLKTGYPVDVAGFGKFFVKERAARMGINPRTKEKRMFDATKVPAFKASKALKESVK